MKIGVSVRFCNPESGGRHFMPVGDGYSPDAAVGPLSDNRIPVILCGMPMSGSCFDLWYDAELEIRYPNESDFRLLSNAGLILLIEAERVVGEAIPLR